MRTFKDLSIKERCEYIGIMAIYPLILLYEQIGKSVKFLNTRKRQITASILTVCLMLTMIPVMSLTAFATTADWSYPTSTPAEPFADGTGDESDPYIIATAQQLANMSYLVNNDNANYGEKHYKLSANIDLAGGDWTPVGDYYNTFMGTFDGAYYTISNLTVQGDFGYCGLFGYVSGMINNVAITNANVNGSYYVGGVAGYLEGAMVNNCSVSGSISGNTAGGISGYLVGTIYNCFNTATVTATAVSYSANAGGITGYLYAGDIMNSYNAGAVSSSVSGEYDYADSCAGGIVGFARNDPYVQVINCYNIGAVTAENTAIGSDVKCLAGALAGDSPGSIFNSYWLTTSAATITGDNGGKYYCDSFENSTDTVSYNGATDEVSLLEALNTYVTGYSRSAENYGETAGLRIWAEDTENTNNGYPIFEELHIHDNITFTPWFSTDILPTTSGNYYLVNDVTATGNISIASGANITLCLNGNTLDMGSYNITNNGTLTICDCQETAGGITSSSAYGVIYVNGGKVIITAGNIIGTSYYGVYLAEGDLDLCGSGIISAGSENISGEVYGIINKGSGMVNIYGDAQVRAKSQTYVYGVCNYYNSGAMNIYGNAKISATDGNSPSHGVYNYANSGTVNIYDNAEITATGNYSAHGVQSDGGTGTVNIYGSAKVTASGATYYTYGVYNDNSGALSIRGNAQISATGNSNAYGIRIGNGTVDISDNVKVSATSTSGRNIAYGVHSGSTGTVSISENVTITATGSSYGVYNNGTAYVSGGIISGDRYGIYNSGISLKLFLSGSPSINGDDTNYADIYCADTAMFYATKGETAVEGEAYTGGALTLEHDGSKGTVAVYNSTDTNKFSLVNNTNGYILAANNGNLILAVPHTHAWATDWTNNATHHWHECENADCTVTEDSEKDGYGEHTALADDGNCLTAVYCECGEVMVKARDEHTSTGNNVATYWKAAKCDVCDTTYGDVLPDNIKPTGEIKIANNGWKQFWNTVTFGLFCKDYVEIEITAEDNELGVAKIEYYLSDTAIFDTEIGNITGWQTYTDKINITANDKRFVYAKITDNAGNVTYLSVDGGIVVFKDTQITTGEYEYTLTTKTDIVTNIKPGSNTVNMIDICEPGGNARDMLDYFINSDGYIVLKGESLEGFTKDWYAGDYTVTVMYNALGEEYGDEAIGDKITDTVLTLKVKRFKVEKPAADSTVFTYNGSEQTYTVAESDYYTVTGNKRTNAGEQDVTVALKDTNTFEWADGKTDNLTFKFNIGKATPNIGVVSVTAPSKIYFNTAPEDITLGRTDTAVSGSLKLTAGQTLTVGTREYDWSFNPDDTVNYKNISGKVSVTVSKIQLDVSGVYWDTIGFPTTYDGTKKNVYLVGTLPTGVVAEKSGNTAINAGNYTATATFKLDEGYSSENYEIIGATDNKAIANWVINPKVVVATVIVSPESYTYTGNPIIPGTVIVNDGGAVIPASEYEVDYINNTNAGVATVNVTDIVGGNYQVSGTQNFVIGKADPEADFPTDLSIDTGKKLSDIALPEGYTWDNPDTAVTYGINKYAMTYVVPGPYGAINYNSASQEVEVNGLDVTAPTGEINLKNNKWTEFLNGITFGIFFKETQSITITAADTESGVKEIAYYLSAEELSIDDVKALENSKWTVYTAAFNVEPDNKYVVYAKLTDNAGNVVYINSNGIVLDSIPPVIAGVEDGRDVYGDATFIVDEEYLDTVTLDGEPIEVINGEYSVPADNMEHTIVVTDKTGNAVTYKLTVYKNYKVSFVVNGEEIDIAQVGYGKDATLPEIPTKEGYTAKWDVDGKNITSDTVITAIYEKLPATGDKTNLPLWTSLLILSGISVFGIIIAKKRKEEENK